MKASIINEQVDNEILLNIDKLFRKLMMDDMTFHWEDRIEHCQDVAKWLKEILPEYIDNSLQLAQNMKPLEFSYVLEDQRREKAIKDAEEQRAKTRESLKKWREEHND